MKIDFKILLLLKIFIVLLSSCDNKLERTVDEMSEDDIELFRGLGVDIRYVPNPLNGRLNVKCGKGKHCDLVLRDGKLINPEVWPHGESEADLSKFALKVFARFHALELHFVNDLGTKDIIFRQNGRYAIYTEDICFDKLFNFSRQLVNIKRHKENWYILEFQKE